MCGLELKDNEPFRRERSTNELQPQWSYISDFIMTNEGNSRVERPEAI